MTTRTTWARHTLAYWEDRALSPELPGPVRVAALAYSRPRANRHVTFATGDLAAALFVADRATGEVRVPPSRTVREHVRKAVGYGLLAEGSTVRCLRLPPGAADVSNAPGVGTPRDDCPVCGPIR